MPHSLSFLGLLSVGIVASAADNWPEFRGPHGNGQADAKGLPLKWSEKENIRWKTAIHDKGWSSPVIWGNQVWVTTAGEKGDKCYAVGLDRETGKIIHDLLLFEVQLKPVKGKNPPSVAATYEEWAGFNSYASPTPVIEEGRVYVHFGVTGTACIDTSTGKILWKQTDLKCNHHRGAGSSPILYGDLLILTFDGFDVQYLAALNKKTGDIVWKHDRKFYDSTTNGDVKKAYSTPTVINVDGRDMLISAAAGGTGAYDPKTGEEIWRVMHGGMNASVRPLFANGKVFTSSSDGGMNLVAVQPNGTGNVTKTNIEWTYNKSVPNRSSFLFANDVLYMANSGGIISCLNTKTGKELNTARLDAKKANFWCSPIMAEAKWYTFDDQGQGYVISLDQKLEVLATNTLDAGTRSSPAAVGNALYVRTFTHLYRIEEK
jgi:outer membrane protein assembly factor BamB